jgi:hypothetical protein
MHILAKQIFFKDEQRSFLSPACIPYFNARAEEDLFLEYSVILRLFEQDFPAQADYTGVFSWRFAEKTRIAPLDFFSFCRNNPGYDVYFINPFPEQTKLYSNVWEQGEKSHCNLKKVAQNLFDELQYDINIDDIANDDATTLFSNYWIGNAFFWERYIRFTRPIYEYIRDNSTRPLVSDLKSLAPYHYPVSYIPFVMERLFSTLLWKDQTIKAKPYLYSEHQMAALITELRVYEYGYKKYFQKFNSVMNNYWVQKLIKYGLLRA